MGAHTSLVKISLAQSELKLISIHTIMNVNPIDPEVIHVVSLSGKDSCWGWPAPFSSCCPDSCCAGKAIHWDTSALHVPVQLTALYEAKRLKEFADDVNTAIKKWTLTYSCAFCPLIYIVSCFAFGSACCYEYAQKSAVLSVIAKENSAIRQQGLEWQLPHYTSSCC